MDVPDLSGIIIEGNEPNGPFGAKEVGEGCLNPVAPAILNAVYDACGLRVMQLPITAEVILKGLKAKEQSGARSYLVTPPPMTQKVIQRVKELTQILESEGRRR